MLATIRTYMQDRRERRAARDRYDEHADLAGSLLWAYDYNDRKERVENLELLVYLSGAMARECAVFDHKRTDEDGYTPPEWHQNEASLFLLALAVETGDWTEVDLDEVASELARRQWIAGLLGDLAGAGYLDVKGHVLMGLCDAVAAHVGGQAADVLAALAHVYFTSSGMSNAEAETLVWPKSAAR